MRTLPTGLLSSAVWRSQLSDLAARHRVPGAQVGILQLDSDGRADVRVETTGVTSLSTGVEVTPETLFQYGSITKVWTATLIMQLLDEGLLDLDSRVVDIVADFALANGGLSREITVRQLLDHTSGIDGDVFTDTGDGDDCLARYVGLLRTASSVTRPGGHHSYCNAGFVVAGRIVEILRQMTWDEALAKHVLSPLGLEHTITRSRDAPLFRTAVGHLKNPGDGDGVAPTTTWMLPRAIGPAGLITGSATDLLTFAAAHLRDGLGLNQTRILSTEAARAMRQVSADLSADSTTQRGWGLGWSLLRWGQEISAAHGGGTIGQIADLQLFPERGLALAVLTNSRGGTALIQDLYDLLSAELDLVPPSPTVNTQTDSSGLRRLTGTWESTALRWHIAPTDTGALRLSMTNKEKREGESDPEPQLITASGAGRFLINYDGVQLEVSHVDEGGREYLYFGRLLQRTV